MKIQWNSDAAQEVLERLRRAQRGLDDSMVLAHRTDLNLEDANAEGDDEALNELAQRLGECSRQLSGLAQQLSDFRSALNRADDRFDETGRHIRSMIDELEHVSTAGVYADHGGGAGRESMAYDVMPDMRTQSAPLPDWLNRVLADTNSL